MGRTKSVPGATGASRAKRSKHISADESQRRKPLPDTNKCTCGGLVYKLRDGVAYCPDSDAHPKTAGMLWSL